MKVNTNLASLVLQHELLPLDILLLALIDRDDDPYALRIVVCYVAASINFLICVFSVPLDHLHDKYKFSHS